MLKYGLRGKKTMRLWVAAQVAAEPDRASDLAAQLRQVQWQIEALHTLIDQAEVAYKIDIRKKGGAKPSE